MHCSFLARAIPDAENAHAIIFQFHAVVFGVHLHRVRRSRLPCGKITVPEVHAHVADALVLSQAVVAALRFLTSAP